MQFAPPGARSGSVDGVPAGGRIEGRRFNALDQAQLGPERQGEAAPLWQSEEIHKIKSRRSDTLGELAADGWILSRRQKKIGERRLVRAEELANTETVHGPHKEWKRGDQFAVAKGDVHSELGPAAEMAPPLQ